MIEQLNPLGKFKRIIESYVKTPPIPGSKLLVCLEEHVHLVRRSEGEVCLPGVAVAPVQPFIAAQVGILGTEESQIVAGALL